MSAPFSCSWLHSAALLLLILAEAGCGGFHVVPLKRHDVKVGGFTKHYEGSYFEVAEGGAFSVELLTRPARLKAGYQRVDIVVHDRRDRDVEQGQVSAVARALGTEAQIVPRVLEQHSGIYTLEGVALSGPSDWVLTITIRKDGVEDRVVFRLPGAEGAANKGT
ncbi:MAG: hypothetical protein HZB55_12110 [Deltaproteobacteria bacterium]|nr:hypothetical protein [Deltaproteobacteria bacterium]